MGNDTQKKVSVYQLFETSTNVRIDDPSGRYVEILLVKPTWKIRTEATVIFEKERQASLTKFTDQDKVMLKEQLRPMSREQIIQEIMREREAIRRQYLDLYPLADSDGLTDTQRQERVDSLMAEWKAEQTTLLSEESDEALLDEMTDIAVKRKAFLDGARVSNYYQLSQVCRDPETKELIFKTPSAVEDVLDPSIIARLVTELNNLFAVTSQAEVREAATSPDFLGSTISPNPAAVPSPSEKATS